MKHKVMRLTFVSTLVIILTLALVSASPTWTGTGNYVRSIWWAILLSPDEYLAAELMHDIDAGGIPRPTDLPAIICAGYTVNTMPRLGQSLLLENNCVWPLGTVGGGPVGPGAANNWRAQDFRRALHRLVDRDAILALTSPLHSKAEFWLPPSMEAWIDLSPVSPTYAPLPPYNPGVFNDPANIGTASSYLNGAGFTEGSTPNPHYKPALPWSAQYMRIDPLTGTDLAPIELLTINPAEAPLTYEAALMMQYWWQTAGIPIDILASTFGAIISRLTNAVIADYQIIFPVDIFWDTTAPDILYDLTYSLNLPLWNFAAMNIPAVDTPCEAMMSTLIAGVGGVLTEAYNIQFQLFTFEPYLPLLVDNGFSAFTGPFVHPLRGTSRGYLGIVNAKGYGALSAYDTKSKKLGRADVRGNEEMIWGLGETLDTLNPLIADTQSDWQVLSLVTDVLLQQNPYNQKYMAWAADPSIMNFAPNMGYTPIMKPWVGPGRAQMAGDGVYNAPVTYAYDPDTGRNELATYNGIKVDLVTSAMLLGDDQVGMRTVWKLRDDLYWHDSDPGPDCKFGTGDDGTVYQVTTADVTFMMNKILIGQQNERYFSNWWYVNNYTAIDTLKFEVYEERQYVFAFEGHDVALLGPKHIWEGDLIGPDKLWGTIDDIHHQFWTGWQVSYMENMILKRNGMPGWQLSRLIGFGPYTYHISGPEGIGAGWQPGILARLETNPAYFGTYTPWFPTGNPGRILQGDVDLNQRVDLADIIIIIEAFGSHPGDSNWDPRADIVFPAQFVNLDDFNLVIDEFGQTWGPYRPYTIH